MISGQSKPIKPVRLLWPSEPPDGKIEADFDARYTRKPGRASAMSRKNSIFDSVVFLALIGILAGAVGGIGIGLVVKSATTASGTSSSSSTQH
jgi:hypothetical protein